MKSLQKYDADDIDNRAYAMTCTETVILSQVVHKEVLPRVFEKLSSTRAMLKRPPTFDQPEGY